MDKIKDTIPPDIKERTPLFQSQWLSVIKRMRNHPDAPIWNSFCGDRLYKEDVEAITAFEETLYSNRQQQETTPNDLILKWIFFHKERSDWFCEKLKGIDLEKNFTQIDFMLRENLQVDLDKIVPRDEPLQRLVVNPTSGTTGRPIACPSHPVAVGCYNPLIRFILKQHKAAVDFDYNHVAAIQVCSQEKTITYNTVHSALSGAGFAKINLNPSDLLKEWKQMQSPARYISAMEPLFLSGDPFSFIQAVKYGVEFKPAALLSTAITLESSARHLLQDHFKCPVINFYSLNETGPIAYSCPGHPDIFHLVSPDIYIEVIGENGQPLKNGEPGEIVFTGGRNPYLPLLRYKTGDTGVIDFTLCSCGYHGISITRLFARKYVLFKTPQGSLVNPVDISRELRKYPVILHQFIQDKNYNGILNLWSAYPLPAFVFTDLSLFCRKLFHDSVEITICENPFPVTGKLIPYISEINPDTRGL